LTAVIACHHWSSIGSALAGLSIATTDAVNAAANIIGFIGFSPTPYGAYRAGSLPNSRRTRKLL